MGERFEQRRDAEVPASPEEVWAAIATGSGIDSWFMGHSEVEPGDGGTVRTVFGDYAPELDIIAWDPTRRFGYRSGEAPDGRFIAYEFLIEGRGGGSTVLRSVTSGFIPGDDWADEYEAMTAGGDGYFRTLVEYLTHFSGRYAVPVTAFGPRARRGGDWARDRAVLCAALGLSAAAPGEVARFTPAETGRPVDGVVYHATPSVIAVRTAGAFYRFLRGFGHPVVAAHQLFSGDTDPDHAARAWESWLARVLDQTSLPKRRTAVNTVMSADGTTIAYDRTGAGEPVVLVAGAFSYRRYPGQVKLAGLLSARFTVINYDRRGRGDSGDTPPYSVGREIEDLAAVIGAAGGQAHVWGLSSGAVLALEAAAAGLPIRKLAVQEPPLAVDPADRRPPADLRQHVTGLIAAGQRGAAVRYFMVDGMGAPSFVPGLLRLMPGTWKKLTAVAHTLPYDAALIEPYQSGRPLPPGQWAAVTIPTLVMCGDEKESPAILRHGSAAVATALPAARLVERRGLGHAKKLTPAVIAATLTEFLTDGEHATASPPPVL